MKAEQVYELIRNEKIIAIARGAKIGQVVNPTSFRFVQKDFAKRDTGGSAPTEWVLRLAEALLAGGIKMLEVTCNTDGVFEMIKLLREKMAGRMCIGAGTVITTDLCKQAIKAGAEFIIAPDTNTDVIDYCVKKDIAVLPGSATATEILTAKRHGAKMVKIFPASAMGINYIKALRAPIDDVDFVAVDGVRPENMAEFFAAGCVAIGIGASVVRKEFIEKGDWKAITETAQRYVQNLPRSSQRTQY
jgi:2-dehydro-3-deoxyphosphogluconate aldolase/(4S)-4-hydroxy-2-oxoglutarate aldolase